MRESAVVNYHINNDRPQAFRFDVDGIAGNLISPDLVPTTVQVQDVRTASVAPDFNNDSITFERHESEVADFDGTNWVPAYEQELRALLADSIGAVEIIVFDHTVREDHPNAVRPPARNVHTDYSTAGAQQRLIDLVGTRRARDFESGHYGFVNIWRPIDHVIQTSPLGFIRPSSMRPEDWMTIELIYPDRRGQILGVAANVDHDWFYQSHMTPAEIAIFNIYDSAGRAFLGHSALDMPVDGEGLPPRKSIESRTLIRYQ